MRPAQLAALGLVLLSATFASALRPASTAAQSAPRTAANAAVPPEAAAMTTWGDGPSLAESLSGPARADYDGAKLLFDVQDYSGALIKFQRAFSHSGDLRLLWNMAVCERNLRRYARVYQLVDRYWREGHDRMSAKHRGEVRDVLQTVRTLISSVELRVEPAGSSIYVDDDLIGTAPLAGALLVDLGARRIRISKPGFQPYEVVQDFAGGSELTLDVALTPEVLEGELSVMAAAHHTIRIDGTIVGSARWQGNLPAGEHVLRVSAPGMEPYTKTVWVEAGQTRTLYVSLEPEDSGIPGWVWIGAGALVAGGVGVAAYVLLQPNDEPQYEPGTLPPGAVQLLQITH